jgi:hypothetical protein
MALKRLQQRIPIGLDLRCSSYPLRHAVIKLPSHYAHCRRKYERAAVGLKGSKLNRWPAVEGKSSRIIDVFG